MITIEDGTILTTPTFHNVMIDELSLPHVIKFLEDKGAILTALPAPEATEKSLNSYVISRSWSLLGKNLQIDIEKLQTYVTEKIEPLPEVSETQDDENEETNSLVSTTPATIGSRFNDAQAQLSTLIGKGMTSMYDHRVQISLCALALATGIGVAVLATRNSTDFGNRIKLKD